MIVEVWVSSFSIPLLAERLGFPRATIYKFFPTPYAVFNELALREVSGLEAHLLEVMQHVASEAPWTTALDVMVNAAAAYYGRHPVAVALLLGGPVTDGSSHASQLPTTPPAQLSRRPVGLRQLAVPRTTYP